MAEITVDLTNYKDKVGSRIAPGEYRVVVDDAELDKSRAGNDMINVWYRVLDGEYKDASITDRLTITEKALFRVVAFMQAVGLPTPRKRLNLNLRNFIGKQLIITVDDGEPYNGRVKSEVRDYTKVAKSSKADTGGDDLSGLEPEETPEEKAPAKTSKPKTEQDELPVDVEESSEDVDLNDVDLG